MNTTPRITSGERRVALFVILYIVGFTIWFFSIGNYEFIVYIVTMLVLLALVGFSLRKAEYPLHMLWALAGWGLLHCAGGGVPVNGGVLYAMQLIPITSSGEMTLLKYDQVVHALGFAVTAWVLWHLLTYHYPQTRHSWTAYVFPALASMGLGATNEIIEFSAVVMVQDTGVGGYTNTLLDLCFNALGAVSAMIWIAWRERAEQV